MEKHTVPARRGPKPKPYVRENLLRTGAALLHEGGFTGVGIQEMADAANIPKGSFYSHFESKEAFGVEAIDYYFESHLPSLQRDLENAALPPLERLRVYFEKRMQSFKDAGYRKGCMLGNFSLEVSDYSRLMRERLATHFQTWSRLLEHCIAQAQSDGSVRNPLPAATLAQFLLNSWEGALLRMRVGKSSEPLENFMHVVFTLVLV